MRYLDFDVCFKPKIDFFEIQKTNKINKTLSPNVLCSFFSFIIVFFLQVNFLKLLVKMHP